MTTKSSEANPTGELREWKFNADKTSVLGRIYHHDVLDEGQAFLLHIKEVRDYKDHFIFTDARDQCYLAYKVNMKLNGGL